MYTIFWKTSTPPSGREASPYHLEVKDNEKLQSIVKRKCMPVKVDVINKKK